MDPTTKRLLMKFTMIVSMTVVSFCIIASVFFFVYAKDVTYVSPDPTIDIYATDEEFDRQQQEAVNSEIRKTGGFFEGLFATPPRTNFLIMGIDNEASLADVIMVGCFNSETEQLDMISVPRDTIIKMPQDRVRQLQAIGRPAPANGEMKINETHSRAGKDLGSEFTKLQVEELLGIEIDFYVEVSLSAFRRIVDGIGGVTMTIRPEGMYYSDPEQNLSINLPGGTYNLTGAQAEGLVRFRTYPNADMKRMEVQQDFIKALLQQVLNRETLLKNAPTLVTTFLSYVKTDFKITELPRYLDYVNKISMENVHMTTLPGEARAAFHYDPKATAELVSRIFYSVDSSKTETIQSEESESAINQLSASEAAEEPPVRTPKDFRVQMLNGGNIEGIAARQGLRLQNLGYKVVDIGNHSGAKQSYTRVIARTSAEASEFTSLFSNSKVVIDANLAEEYDIVIILGLDEK